MGNIGSRIVGTLILIAIIATPIYLIYRSRHSSWTGEVVDKKEGDEEISNASVHEYKLKIKHENNDKIRVYTVSEKTYSKFEVGDKVIKNSGKIGFVKA
jgi:hypothetical protein